MTIVDVSDTAFMVAAFRARETARPDALFRDPLAAKLAGEQGQDIIESLPGNAFLGGWTVVIRTRIIDNFIQRAIADGVDTIVNLGAGLDARPYRMDVPASLRWVEVDYPKIMSWKEDCLADEKPRCQLERVGLDLSDGGARRALLKRVTENSERALVLTEGVVPYLTEEEVASLGAELRASQAVRGWIVDYFSPAAYRYRQRSGMSRSMANAPFRFEPKDYFEFFSEIGWTAKEIDYLAEEAERLHRPAPFPMTIRLLVWVAGLVTPREQREARKRYAGFAWFEPNKRR